MIWPKSYSNKKEIINNKLQKRLNSSTIAELRIHTFVEHSEYVPNYGFYLDWLRPGRVRPVSSYCRHRTRHRIQRPPSGLGRGGGRATARVDGSCCRWQCSLLLTPSWCAWWLRVPPGRTNCHHTLSLVSKGWRGFTFVFSNIKSSIQHSPNDRKYVLYLIANKQHSYKRLNVFIGDCSTNLPE